MSAEQDMQTDQPKDGYDLLPCAHCGAKANLHEQDDPEGYRHSVECGACHVATDRYLTPFAAVKGWNTRSPAHAGMKEALLDARVILQTFVNQEIDLALEDPPRSAKQIMDEREELFLEAKTFMQKHGPVTPVEARDWRKRRAAEGK